MQFHIIDTFLNTMGVTRYELERAEAFPSDDSCALEMKKGIEDSRQRLIDEYEAVCEVICKAPELLPFNCDEFQKEMLKGILQGYDPKYLNSIFRVRFDVSFYEDESSLYFFETTGMTDIETMQKMPAHDFVLMIFNEMKYQAQKPENYTSERIFKREICQRHYFTLFVLYYIMQSPLR